MTDADGDAPQQLDRRQFAQHLHVDPQTVTRGVREHRYPQPDGWISGRPWWWRTTALAFQPRPAGRPKKTNPSEEPTP